MRGHEAVPLHNIYMIIFSRLISILILHTFLIRIFYVLKFKEENPKRDSVHVAERIFFRI